MCWMPIEKEGIRCMQTPWLLVDISGTCGLWTELDLLKCLSILQGKKKKTVKVKQRRTKERGWCRIKHVNCVRALLGLGPLCRHYQVVWLQRLFIRLCVCVCVVLILKDWYFEKKWKSPYTSSQCPVVFSWQEQWHPETTEDFRE